MEWIEVTAKTVEGAIELALDSLGVHRSDLEYEVVEAPKSGFLGIGRGNARVRARVKPLSREKPQDKRRRRRNEQQRSNGGANGAHKSRASGTDAEANGGEATSDSRPTKSNSRSRSRKPVASKTDGEAAEATPESATSKAPSKKSRSKTQGDVAMPETTMTVEEQLSEAQTFTVGLMDAFGLTTKTEARLEDENILVDIDGENLGLLVGPKGATLAAIEELVRTAVLVRSGGFGARIYVDAGGYRRKRREALAGFTQRIAAEVLENGVAKSLEPMAAADRKVVHDTVSGIEGIATTSEGEEPRRRVVIRPA